MYNFYTDMASVANFTIPDPSTVCFWYTVRGYNPVANYLMGTEVKWCAKLLILTLKVEAGFNQDPSGTTDSTSTVAVGTRIHLCFTNLRSTTGLLYWNGIQENSNSGSSTPTSPNTLSVGGRTGEVEYANGDIEDMRIYNRVISPSEVKCIYHSNGRDNIVVGLINRWGKLSKGNGTNIGTDYIYDETASRKHLQKVGAGNIYYRGGFLNPRRRV